MRSQLIWHTLLMFLFGCCVTFLSMCLYFHLDLNTLLFIIILLLTIGSGFMAFICFMVLDEHNDKSKEEIKSLQNKLLTLQKKHSYGSPTATTVDKTEFIFSDQNIICHKVTQCSILESNAKLVIPNGSIFEVRKPDNTVSFKMVVHSDSCGGFMTEHSYQTAPNAEPTTMNQTRSIAICVGKGVKVRLSPGIKYHKIINDMKPELNGKPIIDVIPVDTHIDAYLVG